MKVTNELLAKWKANDDILFIYEFESVIRKQFMADSDSEYVLIVKDEFNNIESSNIEIYTVQEWFDMAEKGELVVYRCNSLKPRYVHKEYVSILPKFCILNIRNEVSAACHAIRNLLKCHFDQEQYALGKQILYRALQYVNWGIQIMVNRKIVHLELPNENFINIILNPNNTYQYYEETYLNKLDELLNEFKSYSENEYQEYKRKQIIKKNENNNT